MGALKFEGQLCAFYL